MQEASELAEPEAQLHLNHAPKARSRVFLADPALCSHRGHYFNFAHCLVEPLRRRGHEVHVLANRFIEPELSAQLPSFATFTHGHSHQDWDHYAQIFRSAIAKQTRMLSLRLPGYVPAGLRNIARYRLDQLFHHRDTVKDLQRAHEQFQFRESDVVIVNSLEQRHLPAFFSFIGKLPPKSRPVMIFILHFSIWPEPGHDSDREAPMHHAFGMLTPETLASSIFVADSEALASEYSGFANVKVGVVPIPHGRIGEGSIHERKNGDPIRFAYVGVGAPNKGFHFLPYLVHGLRHELEAQRIGFEIQAQFLADDPLLRMARDRLRDYSVKVHDGAIDSKQYYEILSRADVILQPYDWLHYHAQTSGIFAESRSFGKVSIVTRGTWMARNVERQGGGVVCLPNDPEDLLLAARTVLRDFERLALEASAQAKEWNSRNSPAGFIAALNQVLAGRAAL